MYTGCRLTLEFVYSIGLGSEEACRVIYRKFELYCHIYTKRFHQYHLFTENLNNVTLTFPGTAILFESILDLSFFGPVAPMNVGQR